MEILERTKTALAVLAPIPVVMDRYLSGAVLPDTYIVYDLVVSNPSLHLDDDESGRSNLVQVTVFNRSGLSGLPDIDAAMTAAGFTKSAKRPLDVDAQNGHYGLAQDYYYYEETIA
jgi:hypothetical protein